jgi:IS30 family transposase
MRAQGVGVRQIARRLGRDPSTISRELRRNAATRGGRIEYRATNAQWHADLRAKRPKAAKLAVSERLRRYVQDRLDGAVTRPNGRPAAVPGAKPWKGRRHGRRTDRRWATAWSPEQIAGRLAVDFPDDESMRISHEAIYQALYIQGRGALRRELTACLRTGRALRVPRARTKRGKNFVTDQVMISQRPAEVGDRDVPGHWESLAGLDQQTAETCLRYWNDLRIARGYGRLQQLSAPLKHQRVLRAATLFRMDRGRPHRRRPRDINGRATKIKCVEILVQ